MIKALHLFILLNGGLALHATDMIAGRYDHEMHNIKVFKPLAIECSHCHNFAEDKASGKILPNAKIQESVFRMPMKQICHECHRGSESKYDKAPKTCITCHRSMENLKVIKPENHSNISWKSSHSTEARVASDSCLNCHMTSQCTKCHLQRNDAELRNHTRNFKFTHSIQARMQPERCDACHSKSYCVNCHSGKR